MTKDTKSVKAKRGTFIQLHNKPMKSIAKVKLHNIDADYEYNEDSMNLNMED